MKKFKSARQSILLYLRKVTGNAIELGSAELSAMMEIDKANECKTEFSTQHCAALRISKPLRPGWYILRITPAERALGSHFSILQASNCHSLFLASAGENKRILRITSQEKLHIQIDAPWGHFIDSYVVLERIPSRFALQRQWEKIQNNGDCPAPLFQQKKLHLATRLNTTASFPKIDETQISECYDALLERRLQPYNYQKWHDVHQSNDYYSSLASDEKVNTGHGITSSKSSASIELIPLYGSITSLPKTISQPALLVDQTLVQCSTESVNSNGLTIPTQRTQQKKSDTEFTQLIWKKNSLQIMENSLDSNPEIELLYFDHDYQNSDGKLKQPAFKPPWNTRLLFCGNYVGPAVVVRPWAYTKAIQLLEQHNDDSIEISLYAWLLALKTVLTAEQVHRSPHTLYTLSVPETNEAQHKVNELNGMHLHPNDKIFLQRHVNTIGIQAKVIPHEELRCLDLQFQPLNSAESVPSVDIIIPTRDRQDLLIQCIEPLVSLTRYPNYTITIIDNNSEEEATKAYLESLVANHRGKVIVRQWPHEFNYSAINNFAVSKSKQDVLVLLNNDTEITDAHWLCELVRELEIPGTGCVGAKLLYPSGRIQHAGIMTGRRQVAGHAYRFFEASAPGYLSRLKLSHNVAAVTAACLAIRRELFLEIGRLNEQHLPVAFNDVDLCLKVRQKGLNVVWTPKSQLVHHESVSRGLDISAEKASRFAAEFEYMQQTWGELLDNDCAWHPVFNLQNDHWEIAPWCSCTDA